MKVTSSKRVNSSTLASQRYRATAKGRNNEARTTETKRRKRAATIPHFIGVDSEGIGRGKNHRAVLLGVGKRHYIARDLAAGLQWAEVFSFLYSCFEDEPSAAYVGFFLSYDFNQWLRSLPLKAARMLLSKEGKDLRKIKGKTLTRRHSYPVRVEGWELDLLGFKRLSIRPRVCQCVENGVRCIHAQKPWMHICDAGPFFQMSLLNAIEPSNLKDPVCTPAEYAKILEGKNHRSNGVLNTKMIEYNELENEILSRLMDQLARGFNSIGIKLAKDQWYGPGASAAKWLKLKGAVKKRDLRGYDDVAGFIPEWAWQACKNSYFGGWFEIFSHGIIPGKSYNYDINNAYPHAQTKLPHICSKCSFARGKDAYSGTGKYVLLSATVFSGDKRIGAMPYRDSQGAILRPRVTKGWYWQFELDASRRAGLIEKADIHEWVEFTPCDNAEPFADIRTLYNLRLSVGKKTPQGIAIKLNNNSLYGKFAQSVGDSPFNNWLYASFITAHCRTQILDAIATHPGRTSAVLMVATDGICFDSPHPNLPISTALGEWEETEYDQLVLFKPGVYWHKEGKEALLKIKARGVPKAAFALGIERAEYMFGLFHREGSFPGHAVSNECFRAGLDEAEFVSSRGWPFFYVPVSFRMRSCAEAINHGKWDTAGEVQEEVMLRQDSDPHSKRTKARYNRRKNRIDSFIHDLPEDLWQTKYHGEVKMPKADPGFGLEGTAMAPLLEAGAVLRDKRANYDLNLDENQEWETVWGAN
jgi:DNA polymerase type B, organellar and viral